MMQHYLYPMGILQGWHFGKFSILSFDFSNSHLYLSDGSAQNETNKGDRDAEDESEDNDDDDDDDDDNEHEPNANEPQPLKITKQPSSTLPTITNPDEGGQTS
jgi:hypothetical protein